MCHNLLNIQSAKRFVPYQMLENQQMLNDLLDSPSDFLEHIRRYSNALTTSMVFGWRTPTYADKYMQQLFNGFNEFAEINQTGLAALLEFYPILRKLPDIIVPAQKKAKELHRVERELYLMHWLNAKKANQNGTINHCFCVGMAEAQEKEEFSDAQAVRILSVLVMVYSISDIGFPGLHLRHSTRSWFRHHIQHAVCLRTGNASVSRDTEARAETYRWSGWFREIADNG